MSHENNGKCPHCQHLLEKYQGTHPVLKSWFEQLQELHPEAHISCAGRGEKEQEEAFIDGRSRAHFGDSAHNWCCAIDLFVMKDGLNIYDKTWFDTVLAPLIPATIEWYGRPGSDFYELPHCEIKAWRLLRDKGLIKLVDDGSNPS